MHPLPPPPPPQAAVAAGVLAGLQDLRFAVSVSVFASAVSVAPLLPFALLPAVASALAASHLRPPPNERAVLGIPPRHELVVLGNPLPLAAIANHHSPNAKGQTQFHCLWKTQTTLEEEWKRTRKTTVTGKEGQATTMKKETHRHDHYRPPQVFQDSAVVAAAAAPVLAAVAVALFLATCTAECTP